MPSERRQLNVRLTDAGHDLLARLVDVTGLSQADVILQGMRLLARRELPSAGLAGVPGGRKKKSGKSLGSV